jgi:alpha-L-fucosidase
MPRACASIGLACIGWLCVIAGQRPPGVAKSTISPLDSRDAPAAIVEKAANVIPSAAQLAWQRRERIGFIHFGMNTFTDREWGSGTESPDLFNPKMLDARQWVRALKSAGLAEVVLVVKHHDGFVLYPSRYTTHSVKASPWLDGHGDVMRAVTDAAKEYGLAVGFYLSPADRHEARPGRTFGNGSPLVETQIPTLTPGDDRHPDRFLTYHLDDYNRYYMNQLYELLTEYGPIAEVWLDGAPAAGTRQSYAFAAWYDLVHRLQPGAVIFNQNVRWVGNENGRARETEWSVIPLAQDYNVQPSGDLTATDLGSRSRLLTSGAHVLAWYPAEADVSIRPGWFWHAAQDAKVKTVEELAQIYDDTVGRNAVLILNVPPDRRGLFPDVDVQRLQAFGDRLSATFKTNLAQDAAVTASSLSGPGEAFAARNAVDGDADSYWLAAEDATTADLVFELKAPVRFNRVLLGESLAVGQRVESFAVDAWVGSSWQPFAAGTTIGYRRLLRRADALTTQKIRVRILQSRAAPSLAEFGLFRDAGR